VLLWHHHQNIVRAYTWRLASFAIAREYSTALEPLSPRTRRYTLSILRSALERAVQQGVVSRNVARFVKSPSGTETEREPFIPEQLASLIAETSDDPIGPLVVLSATTGLRQGEALGLLWEDLDLDAAILNVRTHSPRILGCSARPRQSGPGA